MRKWQLIDIAAETLYKSNLATKTDLVMQIAFQRGSTPLHQAALNGHLPLVVWLLQHGAHKSLFVRNKMGYTPLEAAHIFGPYPEVEALLGSAMVDPSFDPKSILLRAKSCTQKLSVPASAPCHSNAAPCELTEPELECCEQDLENVDLTLVHELKVHPTTDVVRQRNADLEQRLIESERRQRDSGLRLGAAQQRIAELEQCVAELDSRQEPASDDGEGATATAAPATQWRKQLGELEQRQDLRTQELKARLGQSDQRRLESERRVREEVQQVREELQQRDLASEMRVLELEERLAAVEAAAPSALI